MRQKLSPPDCASESRNFEGADCMSTTHRHFVAAFCRMLRGAAVATAMLALGLSIRAQSPKHPLDGSTGPEYWTATEVL